MRALLILTAGLVLVACGGETPKPRQARAERVKAAQEQVARTPTPRTYRYADGELRVIEVPTADRLGFVDQQRCFVWRDTEFRTATISCGQQPDVDLSLPPGP